MPGSSDWLASIQTADPSVIAGRLLPLGFRRYAEYLASDQWQEIKHAYRASDRPKRCGCGARGRQLHHLTYDRLGAELMTDLVLVCEDCHRAAHGKAWKRSMLPATERRKRRKRKPEPRVKPRLPAHLRPLGAAVEAPVVARAAPERKGQRRSNLKRGEPKPWEWDAGQGQEARRKRAR